MSLSPNEVVAYDPKKPGNTYFQDGCNQTHFQGGRVYDVVGNQYEPDILTLWRKRQAAPEDLRVALQYENKRRNLEAEMARKWKEMEEEEARERVKLQADLQALQDAETLRSLRPLEDFVAEQQVGPLVPMPTVLPAETNLDFLKLLVPHNAAPPTSQGTGVVRAISGRLRGIKEVDSVNIPGFPQLQT